MLVWKEAGGRLDPGGGGRGRSAVHSPAVELGSVGDRRCQGGGWLQCDTWPGPGMEQGNEGRSRLSQADVGVRVVAEQQDRKWPKGPYSREGAGPGTT